MNELQIFNNTEFGSVRTTEINGEVYFVGKDVAEALGYANARNAVPNHVDDEDKLCTQIEYAGQKREVTLINESGLYSLVLSSKLDSAKKFKRWITSEVIPSIRKHGAYATDEVIDNIISNPEFGIKLLTELKEERERTKFLATELESKSKVIEELQPKASYYDLILQCSGLLTTTEISKDYGMSAKKFNKLLHNLGIQYKQADRWFLYSKYDGFGYTQSKTQNIINKDGMQSAKTHMYWTQKGRLFLYDFLKAEGYIPTIEVEDER